MLFIELHERLERCDFRVLECCKESFIIGFESRFSNDVSSKIGHNDVRPLEGIPYVFLATFCSFIQRYQRDRLDYLDDTFQLLVSCIPFS
jgi:hypothetical protein